MNTHTYLQLRSLVADEDAVQDAALAVLSGKARADGTVAFYRRWIRWKRPAPEPTAPLQAEPACPGPERVVRLAERIRRLGPFEQRMVRAVLTDESVCTRADLARVLGCSARAVYDHRDTIRGLLRSLDG